MTAQGRRKKIMRLRFEGFLAFLEHDEGFFGATLPGGFLFGFADPVAIALFVGLGKGVEKSFCFGVFGQERL